MRRFFDWEILYLDYSRNKTSEIFCKFDIFTSPFVFWAWNSGGGSTYREKKLLALSYILGPQQILEIIEGPRGKVNRELMNFYETLHYKGFLRFFATWRKNTIHAWIRLSLRPIFLFKWKPPNEYLMTDC